MGEFLDDTHVRGTNLNAIPVVMLGFGKVGRAFASLLDEEGGFAKQGVRLRLVAVFDRSGGVLGDDLSIQDIVSAKRASGGVAFEPRWGRQGMKASEALADHPHAVLVDASPTEPESGEPGLSHIRAALERGHSSVLASKGPLVAAFAELFELARSRGCRIGISAAVGTPLPSLEIMHLSLRAARLRGFRGVFSTAANGILAKMESGASYEDATDDARRAGVLEADPRLDVEGWDTAFKVLILARSFWNPELSMESAQVRGITGVTATEIARHKESGRRLRLVGTAALTPSGAVTIRVEAEPLLPSDPLHALAPGEKGAEFDTNLMGRLFVKSGQAGPATTAVALAKDILNISAHPATFAL